MFVHEIGMHKVKTVVGHYNDICILVSFHGLHETSITLTSRRD